MPNEVLNSAALRMEEGIITQNGKATAVLQDIESYQRERQALSLLKYLARGDQDYREHKVISDKEADRRFRDKLAALEV